MKKMNRDLSPSDIDQLRQHLIVPLAVGDILHHNLDVEPDMQYGLHMALSEIDPDSALLAIALCAEDIATKTMMRAPIAAALYKESKNIIEDYGPTWLHHYKVGPMEETDFEQVLQTVPEDLEALADLLDALCADLGEESSATVILSHLMSIQARAHMEISEYILMEMEYERQASGNYGDQNQPFFQNKPMEVETGGDNIILFPGTNK